MPKEKKQQLVDTLIEVILIIVIASVGIYGLSLLMPMIFPHSEVTK